MMSKKELLAIHKKERGDSELINHVKCFIDYAEIEKKLIAAAMNKRRYISIIVPENVSGNEYIFYKELQRELKPYNLRCKLDTHQFPFYYIDIYYKWTLFDFIF